MPGPAAVADRVGELGPGGAHVAGFVEELVVADHRATKAGRT